MLVLKFLDEFVFDPIGRSLIRLVRQGTRLVTRLVMRARVKSYRGGMGARPMKEYSSRIASGIRMKDWVIFIFSTLRDHRRMEEFLLRIRS